jgi:hypothetical protein
MSVIRGLMILGVVSQVIPIRSGHWYTYSNNLQPLLATEKVTHSLPHVVNECQWSIKECWPCKFGNRRVIWLLLDIIKILAASISNTGGDTLPAGFWKWMSIEHQWWLAIHHRLSMGKVASIADKHTTSAKYIFVRAEWLCESGHALSKLSETPWGRMTLCLTWIT